MNEERDINIKIIIFEWLRKLKMIFICSFITTDIVIVAKFNTIAEQELEGIIKTILKYVILIMIVWSVIYATIIFARIAMGSKIYSAKEIQETCTYNIIGSVQSVVKKKRSKLITSIGKKLGVLSFDVDNSKYIANVTKACMGNENARKIVGIVGECGERGLSKIEGILRKNGINGIALGNIETESYTIEKLLEIEYVIVVAQCKYTSYGYLNKEMQKLKIWEKNVLGVIVIEDDTLI